MSARAQGYQVVTVVTALACLVAGVVLWQTLPQTFDSRVVLAALIAVAGLSALLTLSVHLARTARREERRAAETAIRLEAEIAERRRVEEAFRESQEELAKAFSTNPAAVALTRLADGLFVDVNDSWERMTGHRREEAIGHSSLELHLWPKPETRHRVTYELHRAGSLYALEETLQRKSGEPFVALISAATLTVRGEELALWSLLDITERKRAEERIRSLQATAAAFSAALTPRQVGEVALTEGLHATGATIAAVGLLADDGQELDVWNSVGLLEHGKATWRRYPVGSQIMLADATRCGKIVALSSPAEYAERYPDGAEYLRELGVAATAAAPLIIRGRVLGALAFSFARSRTFDPADLALLETLAAQTAQALERARLFEEVEHRAAALRDANDRLADADRKKDEFLATLAHELRNPLAPIRFALRVIESPAADQSEARGGLDVISRQVTQLVHLIDDLLDVSRITRNKIQLRKERVALSTLVRAVVEAVEPQMSAAGHRFVAGVGADAIVDADPTRIVQVFANLLNNSAKFTPPAGEITLDAGVEGGEAVVRVRDNGIGIPQESLSRIFDMFHQVDSSTERAAGGLGIGLALAKSLVDLHGGTIAATSDGRDRGAVFTVRLPVVDIVRPGNGSSTAAPAVADATARPLSVLIADDNVDSAEMLAMVVGLAGHGTRVVHDGRSAIADANEQMPDVALLDIGMPGMSGYDVARELRRTHGDRIHLVAITGWGQASDRQLAREAGFDCHMTKPADPDRVLTYLDAVAHRQQCAGCTTCLNR